MTKETLWKSLVAKNPRLLTNPHFTSEGARQFFDRVWNHAFVEGSQTQSTRPMDHVFESIFGKK